jgi:hypothetical protein
MLVGVPPLPLGHGLIALGNAIMDAAQRRADDAHGDPRALLMAHGCADNFKRLVESGSPGIDEGKCEARRLAIKHRR